MSDVKRIKPALSKGTRDFLPSEVAKRNYIFNTIKSMLRKYGFEEIETPAIESLETLEGKYGDEGDKLLFKIRSNRNLRAKLSAEKIKALDEITTEFLPDRSDRGLRYDLTVPLARYVVQHQDKLTLPFKRFHIGPVWRGDNPQKGRYQEFYQCDADVIGSDSLWNEVELTKIYVAVFKQLQLPVVVKVNNRKLIDEVFSAVGITDKKGEAITIIDKEDKIGWPGVVDQLIKLELSTQQIDELHKFLMIKNYFDFRTIFKDSVAAKEIDEVMKHFDQDTPVLFSASLMRGLDYYTGTIWEIACPSSSIGSLGGGGRYDNLTEMFGGQNMSGVGISFGIERIYDVLEELQLFPENITQGVKVLFVPREESVEEFTFQQVQTIRDAGIAAEIFLGNVKKQKQFNYVEQKHIAYLVEIGGNEVQSGKFRLRNSQTRDTEQDLTIADIISRLT